MAVQEILVKYKADTTDFQTKVGAIEAQVKKTDKAFVDLDKTKDKAFDGSAAKGFEGAIQSLGTAIVGAFAVEKIIAFGEAAFHAFAEAELQAKKLQVAVGVSGGLNKDFESLIDQSKELQSISIFSDDDIQKAQTMALQFGLTAKQVEELTPVIADFASATGQSIEEATSAVLRGLEGQGRGLKLYGVEVDSTKSKTENLKLITDQLSESFSGQAKIVGETSFGAIEKLKNKFNDFQEDVGQFIVDAGEATAAMVQWIANGFKPLNEAADESAAHIDSLSDSAVNLSKNALAFSIAGITAQIEQLGKTEGGTEAIGILTKRLKELNLQQFENEISKFDENQLIKKLASIREEAKKVTFEISKPGAISTAEKEKALQEEIKARQRQGKLLDDQNKKDDDSAEKAAEAERKRLEDEAKTTEALRQFTLKTLQENAKQENIIRKQGLVVRIKDEEDLKLAFLESDKQELQERLKNLVEFAESTTDVEQEILNNRIAIGQQTGKITKSFLDGTLKDIEDNAKRQIDILATIKDDPKTKIDEESEAQKKIFEIRKGAAGQTLFLFEQLRDLGLITEQQYTDGIAKLSDQRKQIFADEGAFVVSEAQKTAERRKQLLEELKKGYEDLAQTITQLSDLVVGSQIDDLNAQKQNTSDFFDEQQKTIDDNVEKRLITEGQGEARSAKLKEQRSQSEKKSNEELKKLQRQQAEIKKALAIFDAGINLAQAISVALAAAPPPFNAALAAISAALAGVQLAAIIATPIPKFKEGTSYLERGRNAPGPDTIPVWADEGERIVSKAKNIKHWDIYEAIDENRFHQYVMKNFVTPALKNQQRTYEENKQKTFADNIGQSIVYNGLTYHEADRIRRKGTRITNEESLAKAFASEVAKAITRQKLYDR